MDKWRIFGTGVVAAVCCVAVVACDPGGSGVVTDTPVATVSETTPATASPGAGADPTPTGSAWLLTQLPADALTNDLEGATKTAEFFVELIGVIFLNADLNMWRSLSTDECGYCTSQANNVEDMVARGYAARGGGVTIEASRTRSVSGSDGFTYVEVTAEIDELVLLHPDGLETVAEPDSTTTFGLQMTFDEGAWRVNGVSLS